METFTLLAWLPGTLNFGVKNAAGLVGWLSPEGFVPMFEQWIESACHKYGYMHIPEQPIVYEGGDKGVEQLLAIRAHLRQQYLP